MGKFIIDTKSYPLLFVTYPSDATEADIDSYANEWEMVSQRGKFVCIVDLSYIGHPNAVIRAYMAKKLDQLEKRIKNTIIGEGIIAPSVFQRGLVTAHLWLRRHNRHPTMVFADKVSAKAWANELLAAAGLKAG